MKSNPIVPFILIMALGIALIFFLSLSGVGEQEQAEGEGATTELDGEALVQQSCTSCHGGNLEGSVGPKIAGLDAEHIVDVLENGIEGTMMTPGLKTGEEAKVIAEYISSLK